MRGKICLVLSQRPPSLLEGLSLEVYYLAGGCMQSVGEGLCLGIHRIARGSNSIGGGESTNRALEVKKDR